MAERAPDRIWVYRGLFLTFGLGVIIFRILPLQTGLPGIPGPDFLLATTLAWVLRQPSAVPVVLIVFLFLLGDFLLQRPPGLWTLLVVLASESLRRRRPLVAETPFLAEMGVVAGTILAMVVASRIILWVLFADQPSLGLVLMEALATIMIYPVVVLVTKFVLRMDRLPPVELEAL